MPLIIIAGICVVEPINVGPVYDHTISGLGPAKYAIHDKKITTTGPGMTLIIHTTPLGQQRRPSHCTGFDTGDFVGQFTAPDETATKALERHAVTYRLWLELLLY